MRVGLAWCAIAVVVFVLALQAVLMWRGWRAHVSVPQKLLARQPDNALFTVQSGGARQEARRPIFRRAVTEEWQ